ncbi:uncharacterized protein B0T23DRAFT_354156, partial [Neurospora hispaniola]
TATDGCTSLPLPHEHFAGFQPPTPHRIGRGVGCRYGCHLAYGRIRGPDTSKLNNLSNHS